VATQRYGRFVGSNGVDEPRPIAGIEPITVDPPRPNMPASAAS
jgi:hypothetical protein